MSEQSSQQIEYSLEDKFYACVEIIQNMPKSGPLNPTIGEKLKMYSWFKQVTEGPCNKSQPAFWNLIERYKWDAWKQLGELDKTVAMEKYVAFVLEKIDYCAEHWDWDEMMSKYSDDYEKMGPILRVKFRIIDRELIKEDGTRVARDRTSTNKRPIAEEDPCPRKEKMPRGNFGVEETSKPSPKTNEGSKTEERSLSRSSYTLTESPNRSTRSRKVSNLCAKIDGELRSINAALHAINEATETRHKAFMKIIRSSAIYIAIPSNLSWRSHIFLLLWPFIVHWAIKYYRWFSSGFIDFISDHA